MKRGASKIKKRKSQAGFEYIIIGGFILAILIVISNVAFKNVGSDIKIAKAQEAVDTLASISDQVNNLGPGNTRCAYIRVPSDVEDFSVAINEVRMKVQAYGKSTDVIARMKASFATGKLPSGEGRYKICGENSGTTLVGFYPDGATCGSGDGCRSDCSVTNNANDPDCSTLNLYPGGFDYGTSFSFPTCGNGVLEGSETCETGNTNVCIGGQVCNINTCICQSNSQQGDATASFTNCGNGIVEQPGEACDPPGSERKLDLNSDCGKKQDQTMCQANCQYGIILTTCDSTINPCTDPQKPVCSNCVCVAAGQGGGCSPDGIQQSVSIPGGTCGQLFHGQTCINGQWVNDAEPDQCVNPDDNQCNSNAGERCNPSSCTCYVPTRTPCSEELNANNCAAIQCPPGETCQYPNGATGCSCLPTPTCGDGVCAADETDTNCAIDCTPPATDYDSTFQYLTEDCDQSAGNPTWQCRYSQNDHSNNQYSCRYGGCVVLAAGQTYAGDFLTIGVTDQGDDNLAFSTQCNTIFETGSQNRVCDINGQWSSNAGDSDKDGIQNSLENQGFLGYVLQHNNADTDGDGWRDGAEILAGYNPTIMGDIPANIEAGNGVIDNPNNAVEQCDTQGSSSYCSLKYNDPTLECGINSHCVTQ